MIPLKPLTSAPIPSTPVIADQNDDRIIRNVPFAVDTQGDTGAAGRGKLTYAEWVCS